MNHPLIVLHVLWRLSPGGGVQLVVRRLAAHVDPSDVEFHAVTSRPAWDDLTELPIAMHPLGFAELRLRPWDRLVLVWKVARLVRRLRPDLVQLHSGTAWLGLGARLSSPRTPFVLEVHDAPGSGRHSRSSDRLEGWCVRRLGMVAVCHSRQVERELERLSRIPQRSIRRFPLGIDTERFRPAPNENRNGFRERVGVGPDSVLAVAIGRPARSKRFDLAIDAVATVREHGTDLHLAIIGVGAHEGLREHAASRAVSEQVHLSEELYGDELAAAISNCDILCSTSEYEGFGLTIVEGMSCGLPVVAVAAGGVTDLVVDGVTGSLAPMGDVDGFIDRLMDLCNSEELRRSMGTEGRRRAIDVFDARETASAFTSLYRGLVRR